MNYDVAHIREQGQDIIIIMVSNQPTPAQELQLQQCATEAGLIGTVVPVWSSGFSLQFIAPIQWHPFFRNITHEFIASRINRKLTCI